ncbi:MAG: hypothetical protein II811_02205 [Spirochaetaceae bacterium]|nr:hypothetical protein [Spirochaetaceae bacterium]
MAEALMNLEEQISLISLSEQITLMAYLANVIKLNSAKLQEQKKSNRVGVAKGKFVVPDDIDFCNDEIAQMFGAE